MFADTCQIVKATREKKRGPPKAILVPNYTHQPFHSKQTSQPTMSNDTPSSSGSGKRDAPSVNDFVSSMSFAQLQRGGGNNANSNRMTMACDCDECGNINVIPVTIQEAIDRYKRQKRPLQRTQDRRLVKRAVVEVDTKVKSETTTTTTTTTPATPNYSTMAVWNWVLPSHAEPLLEFGSSHRFVWVKRLSGGSGTLYSIGPGIVGSADETSQRQALPWCAGQVYFVPSRSGKAVGWVHQPGDNGAGGPAELVIGKIPADCCCRGQDDEDDSESGTANKDNKCSVIYDQDWSKRLLRLAQKYGKQASAAGDGGFVTVSGEDGEIFRSCVSEDDS